MKPSFLRCQNTTSVEKGYSATMGWVLFSAGLLGNLLALGLLARSGLSSCSPRSPRSPRPPPSVFYVLVCGLTVTDLLGKCLLSPFVLAAYAQNRSLWGLVSPPGSALCQAFAFFMSFFGLASTLQLLAMALECWLCLGHPFFYRRHVTLRRGALVAPAVGAFCLAFCALPFAGFGKFVQYCPGTWCFIQMGHEERSPSVLGYSVLYASLLALLVLAIVLCNLSAMHSLYSMRRRLRRRRRSLTWDRDRDRVEPGAGERASSPPPLEELDHLVLLALMTVLFTMCFLPLIVSRSSRGCGCREHGGLRVRAPVRDPEGGAPWTRRWRRCALGREGCLLGSPHRFSPSTVPGHRSILLSEKRESQGKTESPVALWPRQTSPVSRTLCSLLPSGKVGDFCDYKLWGELGSSLATGVLSLLPGD